MNECSDILKESQEHWYSDLYLFNIFSYSDVCKGVKDFLISLER